MDTIISLPDSNSSPKWQLIATSERGPRTENQDNYLFITPKGQYEHLIAEKKNSGIINNWPEGHLRLVVADGMGGHNNGRQAAEAVVKALLELNFQSDPQALQDELTIIHNQLFEQFHQGARTPGSTLVMADIAPDGKAVIANIGDSRAYLYHNNAWKLITRDHSEAEFAYRDNEINDTDYARSLLTNTNRIVQAMVFGSSGIIANNKGIKSRQHLQELRIELEKDVFTQQIESGDVLMLASDGLWSGRKSYASPAPIDIDLSTYAKEQMKNALEVTRDNISFLIYSESN
jgi:serine/threonine protein phosphatase PrpC